MYNKSPKISASLPYLVQLVLFLGSLVYHNKFEHLNGRFFRDLLTTIEIYRYFSEGWSGLNSNFYSIYIYTDRNTWTTKELYPHWNAIVPMYWYNSDVACNDWSSQFVVNNGVTLLISIKPLKTTITKMSGASKGGGCGRNCLPPFHCPLESSMWWSSLTLLIKQVSWLPNNAA